MLRRLIVLCFLLPFLALPSSAEDQFHPQAYQLAELRGDITPEEAELALEAMFRHMSAILYHEIGHMLINELDLPVLGWEEDAADSLSTLLLLWDPGEASFNTLYALTRFWMIAHDRKGPAPAFALADEHSLDLQRAYHAVCMMIGASAETFTEIADLIEMPPQRRERCPREFSRLEKSWEAVLAEHRAAEGQVAKIHIDYLQPSTGATPYAEILRDESLLEQMADRLSKAFILPREVALVAAECGEANAFFRADDGAIALCYELAAVSFHTFADAIRDRRMLEEEPRLPADPAN